MKFVQHAQAQLGNGQNISLQLEGNELVLNKGLRIPLREVSALCDVLLSYVPGKRKHRTAINKRHAQISAETMLRWRGPDEAVLRETFPRQNSVIQAVALETFACFTATVSRRTRCNLQNHLCKALGYSATTVRNAVSTLIHRNHFLEIAEGEEANE